MTNVRQLSLSQWRRLARAPENRCLIPLTEFAEWTPDKDPEHGIKGKMWFNVIDQPTFAIGGLWQAIGDHRGFAMVTCDPNELVAPIHPKAITILAEADWERWLTGSYGDVVSLQQPYPANKMAVRGPVFPTRQKAKWPESQTRALTRNIWTPVGQGLAEGWFRFRTGDIEQADTRL